MPFELDFLNIGGSYSCVVGICQRVEMFKFVYFNAIFEGYYYSQVIIDDRTFQKLDGGTHHGEHVNLINRRQVKQHSHVVTFHFTEEHKDTAHPDRWKLSVSPAAIKVSPNLFCFL